MLAKGNAPGERRNRELNGGVPRGWRDVFPLRMGAQTVAEPAPLFAVVSTWNDADVIEANVANCRLLGCERVYLLDNASSDDTVSRGVAAGAQVGRVYETEKYDDDYRCQLQNQLVREVTEAERRARLWWLILDADEFPACAGRLVDRLSTSPQQCVGSNFIDLYPAAGEEYVVGRHPAACFALGARRWGNVASNGRCDHWKHPLVCYWRGQWNIALNRGAHRPATRRGTSVSEADWSLTIFHAPFRRADDTRRRLEMLCGHGRNSWDDDVTRGNGASRRWRSLEAVYAGRWWDVEVAHTQVFGRPLVGVALYPWRQMVPELAEQFSKCESMVLPVA